MTKILQLTEVVKSLRCFVGIIMGTFQICIIFCKVCSSAQFTFQDWKKVKTCPWRTHMTWLCMRICLNLLSVFVLKLIVLLLWTLWKKGTGNRKLASILVFCKFVEKLEKNTDQATVCQEKQTTGLLSYLT